jgi:hypothetical protein
LGNIFTFIQYGAYDICPGPVFQWELNGSVRFVIRLTIFGIFCMYMHYTPLFDVNSVVTVIMSSEESILNENI